MLAFHRKPVGATKLYVAVAQMIRQRIRTGLYTEGSLTPSIARLADEMGVAITTVRQAIELLETEGLLERRQGIGTVVCQGANRHTDLKLPLAFDWNALRLLWKNGSVENLSITSGHPLPHSYASYGTSCADYTEIQRKHISNGFAYAVSTVWVETDLYAKYESDFCAHSVIHALSQIPDIGPFSGYETAFIEESNEWVNQCLHVPLNQPVVTIQRCLVDPQGRVIYAGQPTYRADVFRLERSFTL